MVSVCCQRSMDWMCMSKEILLALVISYGYGQAEFFWKSPAPTLHYVTVNKFHTLFVHPCISSTFLKKNRTAMKENDIKYQPWQCYLRLLKICGPWTRPNRPRCPDVSPTFVCRSCCPYSKPRQQTGQYVFLRSYKIPLTSLIKKDKKRNWHSIKQYTVWTIQSE